MVAVLPNSSHQSHRVLRISLSQQATTFQPLTLIHHQRHSRSPDTDSVETLMTTLQHPSQATMRSRQSLDQLSSRRSEIVVQTCSTSVLQKVPSTRQSQDSPRARSRRSPLTPTHPWHRHSNRRVQLKVPNSICLHSGLRKMLARQRGRKTMAPKSSSSIQRDASSMSSMKQWSSSSSPMLATHR